MLIENLDRVNRSQRMLKPSLVNTLLRPVETGLKLTLNVLKDSLE